MGRAFQSGGPGGRFLDTSRTQDHGEDEVGVPEINQEHLAAFKERDEKGHLNRFCLIFR